MKKTLIALAAVAASGAAFAQSSVTLFGVVDATYAYGSGSVSNKSQLTNSGYNSSRLGFRGVEDLGGGLKAGFHFEGDLDPDTGTPGGLNFQRRSTLSLMGGFGELRMGRDYVPTFTIHTKYDPFGTNGLGSSISMFGTTFGAVSSSAVRANNSLGYLAKFGSFDVAYMYGLRESASNNNDYHGIRVGYNAGPLSVDVATAQETGIGASLGNHNPRRTNVGVAYDFGFIKPMFQYTTSKLELAGGDRKVNNVLLGLTAPVGPGLVRFSYVRNSLEQGATDVDGKQVALGYTYPLSKRTSFNANIARISTDAGFPVAEQTGYEIGIRHTF